MADLSLYQKPYFYRNLLSVAIHFENCGKVLRDLNNPYYFENNPFVTKLGKKLMRKHGRSNRAGMTG